MTEGRWRHKSAGDIDIIVNNITEETADYFKVRVYYILRSNNGLLNQTPEEVKIDKKDLHKWSRIY